MQKPGASVAARWKLWLRDFDTFLVASGIRDAKRQKALLLYQAGPKVREIFNQLSYVDGEGDEDNFATTKAKLIEYFEPQKIGDTKFIVFVILVREIKNRSTRFTHDSGKYPVHANSKM